MPAHPKRFAVSATNHETGETWSIHDSKAVCEREARAKLAEWGTPDGPFELVEITADHTDDDDEPATVADPPVVAEGDGVSDTVES
jgi:hypothetical protein